MTFLNSSLILSPPVIEVILVRSWAFIKWSLLHLNLNWAPFKAFSREPQSNTYIYHMTHAVMELYTDRKYYEEKSLTVGIVPGHLLPQCNETRKNIFGAITKCIMAHFTQNNEIWRCPNLKFTISSLISALCLFKCFHCSKLYIAHNPTITTTELFKMNYNTSMCNICTYINITTVMEQNDKTCSKLVCVFGSYTTETQWKLNCLEKGPSLLNLI